ncbi:SMI1/KNR4 family protein [Streptomyces sp. PSKA54]|uniref:SMI1/KNR4 family protein n=1 Tax=Streptomyces himalayensis subsp. aureolus TaxID=2758039 RepID=A0A7W2CYI8_9ACTN|nr:SMI1/KNR4 family protein [Streptomyces himalayensis]MBA4861458.1 SMI1/KNR4 family protein [Streptomyces himalayensis subsp. aureolus]
MRIREYLSETPVGLFPIPRLHTPAGQEEVVALEQRSGQPLEPHYREFLSLTDGVDGFYLTMPIFGCKDWQEGGRAFSALRFLEALRESDTPVDVGLSEDIGLFPISVSQDGSQGIFMLNATDMLPERFWWVGEGSSSFFGTFGDLLTYAIDPRSYTPRETMD